MSVYFAGGTEKKQLKTVDIIIVVIVIHLYSTTKCHSLKGAGKTGKLAISSIEQVSF